MTNEHEQQEKGGEELLRVIRERGVSMRPKWHFTLENFLAAIGAAFLLVGAVFVASFIVFSLRKSGALDMLGFGLLGWYEFFFVLPWWFIFFALLALLLLEGVLRKFSFAYQLPILYTFAGVLFLSFIAVVVADRLEMHRYLREISESHDITPVRGLYSAMSDDRAYCLLQGGIIERHDDRIVIREPDGDVFRIVFGATTHIPEGMMFATSDTVVVFGEHDDGFVRAMGVRLLPN